jgi:hypothetical protein
VGTLLGVVSLECLIDGLPLEDDTWPFYGVPIIIIVFRLMIDLVRYLIAKRRANYGAKSQDPG